MRFGFGITALTPLPLYPRMVTVSSNPPPAAESGNTEWQSADLIDAEVTATVRQALRSAQRAVVREILRALENGQALGYFVTGGIDEGEAQRLRVLRGKLHNCAPNSYRSQYESQAPQTEKQPSGLPDVQAAQAPASAGRETAAAHAGPSQGSGAGVSPSPVVAGRDETWAATVPAVSLHLYRRFYYPVDNQSAQWVLTENQRAGQRRALIQADPISGRYCRKMAEFDDGSPITAVFRNSRVPGSDRRRAAPVNAPAAPAPVVQECEMCAQAPCECRALVNRWEAFTPSAEEGAEYLRVAGRVNGNALHAAFALFGPRYFAAELRRRVEALPVSYPGSAFRNLGEGFVHAPALLSALLAPREGET